MGREGNDRLDDYRIYTLARKLFEEYWDDSDALLKDPRGRVLASQQAGSLDSICANIEEGFGRGFGKEWPQFLRIARGSARESRGRYERCRRLLGPAVVDKRIEVLNEIIGGLTKTIKTAEQKLRVRKVKA